MNRFIPFFAVVALIGAFVGLGEAGKFRSVSHTRTVTAASTVNPHISFIGGSTCNETTHASFRYRLSDGTPKGTAHLIVTDPDERPYQNVAGSKGESDGIIKLDKYGSFTGTKKWACWYSSMLGTPPDMFGGYQIQFIDNKSRLASNVATFMVKP